MSRLLTIPLSEILDLIYSAETYGFYDDVLMTSFAGFMNNELSEAEIHDFAHSLLNDPSDGFTEDDMFEAITILTDFKDKYIMP